MRIRDRGRRLAGHGLFVTVIATVLLALPSTAHAATWTVVSSPNPGAGDNLLFGADALSPTSAWAVGRFDTGPTPPFRRTLAVRWNGSAWINTLSPTPVDGSQLNDVDATSATNAWAVGTHIQRWNGSAWSVQSAPAGFYGGVKAFSATSAWAVGSAGANTLAARWNGSSWTQVPTPSRPSTFNSLLAVDGTANDLWAVGSSNIQPGYGVDEALILRWNGTTWSIVPAPDQFASLRGIVAVAPNDVWAVGQVFSLQAFHFVPYAIHWNGTSWTRVNVPDPGGSAGSWFNAVTALSATKVYAVGSSGGTPFVMRWNGSAWSTETTPAATGPTLAGAAATGTGTVWGVGYRYDSGLSSFRTLTIRTSNG